MRWNIWDVKLQQDNFLHFWCLALSIQIKNCGDLWCITQENTILQSIWHLQSNRQCNPASTVPFLRMKTFRFNFKGSILVVQEWRSGQLLEHLTRQFADSAKSWHANFHSRCSWARWHSNSALWGQCCCSLATCLRFMYYVQLVAVSFPYCFCFHPDDFADEEEVQSFGYKRFGEYPPSPDQGHCCWFVRHADDVNSHNGHIKDVSLSERCLTWP